MHITMHPPAHTHTHSRAKICAKTLREHGGAIAKPTVHIDIQSERKKRSASIGCVDCAKRVTNVISCTGKIHRAALHVGRSTWCIAQHVPVQATVNVLQRIILTIQPSLYAQPALGSKIRLVADARMLLLHHVPRMQQR